MLTVAALHVPVEFNVISTVAAMLNDNNMSSEDAVQGPTGSSVVIVRVTKPRAMSPADGE